ncbi:EscF/YscF/HrpA family type III secretion system needle major subunit [Arsenophonus sp. PmNCSU2021_1]|uniref:EscF/YscF/HrpA family type III secretion system needle major subunit n=1 Tax=Arsenophonus sp. PmNCSU2021_1 TaxID=3118989 RepID=UPI002FF2FEAC
MTVSPSGVKVGPADEGKFDTTQSVGGYLVQKSASFDKGVVNMNKELDATLIELTKDPSNPMLLAKYQSLLSEYTLYRNLQSNVTKTLKETSMNTIRNT